MSTTQSALSTLFSPNLSMNTTAPVEHNRTAMSHSGASGSELLSLLYGLLSLSPLPDWLNWMIFSSLVDSFRHLLSRYWTSLENSLWLTVTVDSGDESYRWLMYWFSRRTNWGKSNNIEVNTRHSWVYDICRREQEEQSAQIKYQPIADQVYTLWYHGRYMKVSRKIIKSDHSESAQLKIRILSRDHSIVDSLLKDARKLFRGEQDRTTSIYVWDGGRMGAFIHTDPWRCIASRQGRRLQTVILDHGIKEMLLTDCKNFLNSKQWYADRGIPFRRGYLLYGAPGSGKTSLIQALAGELGLDIYIITLSRAGLDDCDLSSMMTSLPGKCIALIEDIDAALPQTVLNRIVPNAGTQSEGKTQSGQERSCQITLSGLLNALDGIGAPEGRILFATTNHSTALDAALCRPGRLDLHVDIKLASKFQIRELFKSFYHAYSAEDEPTRREDDRKELDSAPFTSPGADSAIECLSSDSDTQQDRVFSGFLHSTEESVLTKEDASILAEEFAQAVPERSFSMAVIQGFLMAYKSTPRSAVAEVSRLVDLKLARIEMTGPTSPNIREAHSPSCAAESTETATTQSPDVQVE
ncbi:uncharacterized protein FIBRA_04624 [Fibroporia radiculosa]|uniref:AAA+ ATPase domain-containing protein n=1 Tax=Fibroporia radiculosa TaxID=599839 RepID=J4HWM5_9APHY|nr:uncharacterized protein FIBRA_04624 [Fibroporia radiculosa]CCM02522.1 predicted protein [Fibroporia radiculosa]